MAEDVAKTAEAEGEEIRDDVIAEADVYLAYGIYQQAEDLLNRAINDNPERNDYRVKLAETYYTSKNVDAFVETASQLKERVDNEDSPEWNKVTVMGQDLCPDNPMFQSGKVEDINIEDLAPEVPAMDFDLDKDEPEAEIEEAEQEAETKDKLSMDSVDEIEFDLSDTGAVEEADEQEDEFSLDIDASELDIDTGVEDIKEEGSKEKASKEKARAETDEDELSLEEDLVSDGTDNVVDLSAVSEAEKNEEEVMLDLSDEVEIDSLDMEDAADTDVTDNELVAEESITEEDEFDLSSLDDVDEISTKLDLARAYLDMGDHEGTRGILEEVLVDGNDEQKQEANELMAKLG